MTTVPQTLSSQSKVHTKRVVVAAGLIRAPQHHSQAGKILMTKRLSDAHLANSWEFPGGKIEFGEDPIRALHRELKEELEIEVDQVSIYAVGHHLYQSESLRDSAKDVILLVYECELADGEPQKIGVSDYAWLSPKEVCDLPLPPADIEVINRLRKEIEHV